MFKNLTGLANLLKNAGSISQRVGEMKTDLEQKRVTGTSGGGMVMVQLNGLGEVQTLQIDVQLVSDGGVKMIEELVTVAINQAIVEARKLHLDAMRELTGGVELPGMNDLFESLSQPSK